MPLYPATLNIDFYIQADSQEEAVQKLQAMIEKDAFRHDTIEFPEIEQPEYSNSCVLDVEDGGKTESSYARDEVLLDMAFNSDFVNLKIKFDFDSRELVQAMISWADEFMNIHRHTDWEETDYFLTLDAFADEKLKQFTSQLRH